MKFSQVAGWPDAPDDLKVKSLIADKTIAWTAADAEEALSKLYPPIFFEMSLESVILSHFS